MDNLFEYLLCGSIKAAKLAISSWFVYTLFYTRHWLDQSARRGVASLATLDSMNFFF